MLKLSFLSQVASPDLPLFLQPFFLTVFSFINQICKNKIKHYSSTAINGLEIIKIFNKILGPIKKLNVGHNKLVLKTTLKDDPDRVLQQPPRR